MVDLEWLRPAVQAALRAWHKTEGTAENLLEELLLVQESRAALGGESSPTSKRLATNQVLLEAIDELAEQNEQAAEILRLRFPDDNTLLMVGYRLHIGEYAVSRQQRDAITSLTEIIAAKEAALREKKRLAIEAQLPPSSYRELFGIASAQKALNERLLAEDGPWVLALVGIGGIGKTALADSLVRGIIHRFRFADVIWLRVDPQTMSGRSLSPQFTFEQLIAGLALRLGLGDGSPAEQQLRLVRGRLKEEPHLVVIDNVESDAETAYLMDHLNDLAQPGKFLVTSRSRLPKGAAVFQYSLSELTREDSLALIRHQAEARGVTGVAEETDETLESIYELTGGNPLALKLVVSLLDVLPLPQVLDGLARSRPGAIEELYRYIYWQSWQLLSENAKSLLQAMPLVAESGGEPAYLGAISGLDEAALWPAVQELSGRSLLEVRGTLQEKRYGVHRLTETFLRTEIIDWPEEEE
jgi:hypothetical protein